MLIALAYVSSTVPWKGHWSRRSFKALGLNPALGNWVLDFLTDRHQVVKVGNKISTSMILNTGTPQGCVLSPLMYSLFTHDCVAKQLNHQICRWHNSSGLDYQQRRDRLQGGGEGTGSVVSGKHPLTQRQQNKGDDRGLQETAEGAPPYPHQQDSSREGGKF